VDICDCFHNFAFCIFCIFWIFIRKRIHGLSHNGPMAATIRLTVWLIPYESYTVTHKLKYMYRGSHGLIRPVGHWLIFHVFFPMVLGNFFLISGTLLQKKGVGKRVPLINKNFSIKTIGKKRGIWTNDRLDGLTRDYPCSITYVSSVSVSLWWRSIDTRFLYFWFILHNTVDTILALLRVSKKK